MTIKLTKQDKIILSNISNNPRILEKKLASLCNLSKDSIRYRIKRLEKLNVIKGYSSFIDYTKLGNLSFKIYLKLNASKSKLTKLKNFLDTKKEVFAYFESYGVWNLAIAIFAKTPSEYSKFENELDEFFGEMIINKKFCMMIDVKIIDNKTIFDEQPYRQYDFLGKPISNKLDEKDKILINELYKNSKSTLVSLSGKVGLSIDSIRNRIKKLEDLKIISQYYSKINYDILGYETYKLFIYVKNYSKEKEMKLLEYIKHKKNILNIVRMVGPWKVEAEFLIKHHDDFEEIFEDIYQKFPEIIKDLDYSIYKNLNYYPSDELMLD